MNRKLISLLMAFIPWLLQAQITINIVQPPAGMITKDQLWNLVLTNSSNTTADVNILMNLQDAVTGQSVLSAGTRSFLLGKGVKMLATRDVQPVQYTYGGTGFAGDFLPLGSYVACYTINRSGHETVETLGTECIRINITPLSPPLLNTPADKSVLHTPAPQLTWVPPAPLEMFDDLNYDVSIAEVMPGQSPADAILYNTPLYTSSRIKAPYENYTAAYSRLEAGKTYAWQVTARNGLNYAAVTDVWTFSIAGDSARTTTVSPSYIVLHNSNVASGIHHISGNKLYVKFYSYHQVGETVVKFLNTERKVIQQVKQKIVYGDNYLSFPLNHLYRPGQVYHLEIYAGQNNKQTVSFSIK